MYLQVEGTPHQARLSEYRLSASRGFGIALLRLSWEVTLPVPAEDDGLYSLQLHGLVYLTTGKRSLPFGVVTPPTTRVVGVREGRLSTYLELSVPVAHDAFDAVESHRAGAGVELRFDLEGLLQGPSGERWGLRGQPNLRQESADWERLLQQAGYHQLIRFAVRAGDKGGQRTHESWGPAVNRLRRAQDALLRGDPRGAIGEVRPIIELLWPELPAAATGANRHQRSLEERFGGVAAALKEVTHLSHHEDDTTQGTTWTRTDAIAAIAMVAALMQREGDDSPFT